MLEPMREEHPCIRCARSIDTWAKLCPFCNWNQGVAPPTHEPLKPTAVTDYRPPSEYDLKKKAIFAGAGVLALVAAFTVGMVINEDGAPKSAPKTVEEQLAEESQARQTTSVKRADTPLVPVDGPAGIEQPITSAPLTVESGMGSSDYQRSDATAVSATEYAELAKRAKAEKQQAAAIDPRSLTGPAYVEPPRPRRANPSPTSTDAASSQTAAKRTRPIPEYQPLPHIASAGTARLSLMVGADGRVKQISIERALQRNTTQLLSAVRSWRFKPATVDGEPVAAPYSVEISFKQ